MVKLTKRQEQKLETIRLYLYGTEIGKRGALVGDNDASWIWILKKMYVSASGVWLRGQDVHCKPMVDRIDQRDITAIYRAMYKADEDFRLFVDNGCLTLNNGKTPPPPEKPQPEQCFDCGRQQRGPEDGTRVISHTDTGNPTPCKVWICDSCSVKRRSNDAAYERHFSQYYGS